MGYYKAKALFHVQAAVPERAPARPLWQDLLSDILPGELTSADHDTVMPQPAAANTSPPEETLRALEIKASDTGKAIARFLVMHALQFLRTLAAQHRLAIPRE